MRNIRGNEQVQGRNRADARPVALIALAVVGVMVVLLATSAAHLLP